MNLSLKTALGCISLLFILESCSIRHHSGYKTSQPIEIQNQDFIAHNFRKVLFRTQIQAFGKDISGLLFIKKMEDNDYRFVFLTQIGMKIFDVELNQDEFSIHQLISYLDKKTIRRILEKDLRLLIQVPEQESKKTFFKQKKDHSILLRNKTQEGIFYFQYRDHKIQSKENTSYLFRGTNLTYFYNTELIPKLIKIKHSGINLQWELRPIDKTKKQ